MAVAGVLSDLVEHKLAQPLVRPDTVAKTSVIARLTASSAPFVCVVAPAGYGKTTLVSRWAEADERPFAWVSVDARDDEAVVFMRYIAAAIDRVESVPQPVIDALSGPGSGGWTMRVPPLGRALAGLERPLVLVLDDLHAITNRGSSLDVLGALFEYVPAGSAIVVTSREIPDLPLARWRTQGQLDELGVADLRLDEAESQVLLRAAGAELDSSELSELTRRTEGWAAGLYLAALSLGAGGTRSAGAVTVSPNAHGFTGDDRFVSDYFRQELMEKLPAAEAQFLLTTSVLDRMCGGLCDAVLETTQSALTLERLERKNGFVVPLDRRGEWYRYHHLFGELLRTELQGSDPDAVAGLNRRAMNWCIANGLTEEAIRYGHAAGETATVAGLVDGLALPLYYDGRMATLEEWLGWFSEDELREYPSLAVYGGWLRVLTGRAADGERWLALAEGAKSAIPISDGSATIEPWAATLRANLMRDGLENSLADANLALDQLAPNSPWRSTALLIRGVTFFLLDDTDRATTDLTAAMDAGRAAGSAELVYTPQALLALMAARRGAWTEAGDRAQDAQDVADAGGMGEYATSAIAHAAVARVATHEARHADALVALARAHRLRPVLDHGIPWLTVEVGLELTRAHLALADAGAARTVFTETERALELRPDLGVLAEDARGLRERVAAADGAGGAWAMSLTSAELRLLPYLATHLTFPEIASRLLLSRNTVKTEAVSIYRKLGASSRGEAIDRAIEVGLVDSSIYPARQSGHDHIPEPN